jgi:hypothetical protein
LHLESKGEFCELKENSKGDLRDGQQLKQISDSIELTLRNIGEIGGGLGTGKGLVLRKGSSEEWNDWKP